MTDRVARARIRALAQRVADLEADRRKSYERELAALNARYGRGEAEAEPSQDRIRPHEWEALSAPASARLRARFRCRTCGDLYTDVQAHAGIGPYDLECASEAP